MKKTSFVLSLFSMLFLSPVAAYADSSMYVVVQGDTLTKIAKQYNTSAKALMDTNHLSSDRLYIGQTLRFLPGQKQADPVYIPSQPIDIPADIPMEIPTTNISTDYQTRINKAIVKVDVLNVRDQPSLQSQIVTKLPFGTSIDIVENGPEWTKIKLNEREAYVASSFISFFSTVSNRAFSLSTSSFDSNLFEQLKPLLKTPYVTGGSTPEGFDCSGFTAYVFQQMGITLPRTSEEQFKIGQEIPSDQILPGDLLFYDSLKKGKVSHVALYLGDGTIIHANGVEVKLEKVENMNKIYPYYGAKRYTNTK